MSEVLIALMLIPLAEGYDGKDGDGGRAHGPYQIHDIYRQDVNRLYGTQYVRADCYDLEKSRDMVMKYLSHYGTEKRLGREPTVQDLCRIHSGGPDGWKQECTLAYWSICLKDLNLMAQNWPKVFKKYLT
jgi:hypothetical protein